MARDVAKAIRWTHEDDRALFEFAGEVLKK
jgi:hypothetical protein